ncbi:UNVERIFIED_CONTAM: Wall-associated receptor kinase-like 8 [Sesamum radiatum]|uniref:Wall-associated receptor kinase-like 8 n=1 Tax=Sesamum radiatum TaxID=300843 RepID=A0AAW2TWI2_SESRA
MAPYHGFLLAFLIICSASMLFQAAEIKAEASGDCQRKCGDVEIPYPFGMSKGCYLDEAFRVVCNESTGSASLPLVEWEVESINTSTHTLRHKNFRGVTLRFNSSRGPYVSSFPTVAGNHYSISKARNKFVAIGCDFLAYLIDEDTGKVQGSFGNTSCDKARESLDEYVCGQNTHCIDYYPVQGYRCECNNGYRGNPYLPQSCQDVDECSNPEDNNCPMETHCVNTEGSYFCLPNRTRTGLGVGLLILVAIGIWTWRKLKKIKESKMKQKFFRRNGGLLLQQQIFSTRGSALPELTLFKIEELEKATDNFSGSRVLGKGGHGTVYKGMLSDGRIVSVKKANVFDDSQQVRQFINEHLHDEPNSCRFSWENRLRVAAEVAGALAYMHSYASTAIFHRDVKSSNILLGENYKAVVSDFGLSRSVPIDKTHLTTLVGGTFGYLDPGYFRSGKLNDKSDVYAFGVVLAEILTGQKAVSVEDDQGLAFRFRSAVKDDSLFDILDKVVVYEGKEDEILALAKVAKRCMKINAHKRPSMKEVAAELDQLRKTKEVPGNEVSFQREYRSMSENCHSFSVGSEAEDYLLLPISF